MKILSRHFTFYPLATLVSILAFCILISLGSWQLQRRAWKLDLLAAVAERSRGQAIPLNKVANDFAADIDVEYTKTVISGRFDHKKEAHIFGTLGATPGYYIFTPLIVEAPIGPQGKGTPLVYVNRGFVPQGQKQADTRPAGQILDDVIIEGLFRKAEKRTGLAGQLAPKNDPENNVWYIRDPRHFAPYFYKETPTLLPWYIDSLGTENSAALPRGGTTKLDFNNRHLEYAFTWYGLALTLVGVWLAYSCRKI